MSVLTMTRVWQVVVDEAVPFLVPMRAPKGTELFVQGASSVSLFFIRSVR
jgi:hypothetical protein